MIWLKAIEAVYENNKTGEQTQKTPENFLIFIAADFKNKKNNQNHGSHISNIEKIIGNKISFQRVRISRKKISNIRKRRKN